MQKQVEWNCSLKLYTVITYNGNKFGDFAFILCRLMIFKLRIKLLISGGIVEEKQLKFILCQTVHGGIIC